VLVRSPVSEKIDKTFLFRVDHMRLYFSLIQPSIVRAQRFPQAIRHHPNFVLKKDF
jgi:hypothetical protein